jgi:hypothetical protein
MRKDGERRWGGGGGGVYPRKKKTRIERPSVAEARSRWDSMSS